MFAVRMFRSVGAVCALLIQETSSEEFTGEESQIFYFGC